MLLYSKVNYFKNSKVKLKIKILNFMILDGLWLISKLVQNAREETDSPRKNCYELIDIASKITIFLQL